MEIPKRALEKYARALSAAEGAAGRQAAYAVERFIALNGSEEVALVRDFAIAAVESAVGQYGGATSALACELFDECMAAEGVATDPAETIDPVDRDAIERAVRYQAGKLPDGDEAGFVQGISEAAVYHARRAANITVAHNVELNRSRGVRYARVPQGAVTCDWCLMLASRGFAYKSEKDAAAGSHRHCDCMVVPGVSGKTSVEGYDPDTLYERWKGKQANRSDASRSDVVAASPVFLNSSTELYRRMKKVEPVDGYRDYGMHCDGRVFSYTDADDGHETEVSPKELAEMIQSDPKYDGSAVRLLACSAGKYKDGAAQQLADELGVEVLAADQDVYFDFDGAYRLARSGYENTRIVRGEAESSGRWLVFKPSGGGLEND